MITKKIIGLLGLTAKDKITGFKGVITSISFDVSGCIQACLTPGLDKEGRYKESSGWLDVNRLDIVTKIPVVKAPSFAEYSNAEDIPGPVNKPYK